MSVPPREEGDAVVTQPGAHRAACLGRHCAENHVREECFPEANFEKQELTAILVLEE